MAKRILICTGLSPQELRQASFEGETRRERQRMQALANVMEGMTRAEAARLADMCDQAVKDAIKRYNDEGVAGLKDRPHRTPAQTRRGAAPRAARYRAGGPGYRERAPVVLYARGSRRRCEDKMECEHERHVDRAHPARNGPVATKDQAEPSEEKSRSRRGFFKKRQAFCNNLLIHINTSACGFSSKMKLGSARKAVSAAAGSQRASGHRV